VGGHRPARAGRWIAPALVALAGCRSSAVIQCGGCPGSYLDPNGLIRPGDAVVSVRVCIDGRCTTETYPTYGRIHGHYAVVTGAYPPNPAHINRMQVTTFDAKNNVVRKVFARSLDLPPVKPPPKNSCACPGLIFTYEATAHRFAVTTQ
jgi:hypothetical protein